MIKKIQLICLFLLITIMGVRAQENKRFVSFARQNNALTLAENGNVVPILIDRDLDVGVKLAVFNLAGDIEKVTGVKPDVLTNSLNQTAAKTFIIVGVIDNSPLLDSLVKSGNLNADELRGKREKYILKTVKNPMRGVAEAIVIAGSDKRGAIYGVYELSSQAGVSPWYFWADVPVAKHNYVCVIHGEYTEGEPAIEYRGIFLNDEAPALTGWVNENYGGYKSKFYVHVFELLLRLKANFLWPAMWDAAFYDDDPMNSVYADQMGIVVGTSHHEPMARAHKEWKLYGNGPWDYSKNAKVLDEFWRKGIERMKNTKDIVTLAMRGDGDEPMTEGSNIALLEKIVRNQRKIITEVTGKPADQTPQVWALYKEVQDYYDKGMRVPDDVTLLLCDDNWGNIRKLPELKSAPRRGGYGMYYHFDYVGGPRNYKWINVSQIQRTWEQMNLCYEYGVRKIWIVNVGDLKPMEYPIQFFMDMAWDPTKFNQDNLLDHTVAFCAQQFGEKYAAEAARIINLYTKYNRRITPELLNDKTYSLQNYDEFLRVTEDYYHLATDALRLYHLMPMEYRDAFDQLVLYPTQASANLYEMYYAAAMNGNLYAKGDPETDLWADRVKESFERDAELSYHYNHVMSGGKWNHMMDQVHIGYTTWQQPAKSIMPEVFYLNQKKVSEQAFFVEKDGYVSIEAASYSRKNSGKFTQWIVIPYLGKTVSAMTTTPVTVAPDADTFLEYEMTLTSSGAVSVEVLVSPTLNFNSNRGLRYAISFDGGTETIVNINPEYDQKQLERWQAASINRTITTHSIGQPGRHTLRFRPLDPGIVVQKIMVDLGGLKPSYLGAPETLIK